MILVFVLKINIESIYRERIEIKYWMSWIVFMYGWVVLEKVML